MRSLSPWKFVVAALAFATIAGCSGGESNKGSMPVPAGGGPGDQKTITLGTPTPRPSPTARPTTPVTTPGKPAAAAKVTVVAGAFASVPAVQGLVAKYPQYYQAMVERNPDLIKTNFPAFFYADTAVNIDAAKQSGWVMRPPGSIVVVGTAQRPDGVVRVNYCRSQRTQWWNPKARRWAVVAPKGTAESVDMVRTGLGWTMYRVVRPVPKGVDCSKVRYPA